MREHGLLLLYRNHKAHLDGEPRTATSTFTQLLNSDSCRSVALQLFTQRVSAMGHTGWPLQLFTQRVSAMGHTGWPLQLFTQRVSARGHNDDLQASDCFRRSVPGGPGHVCQSVSLLAVLVILDSLAETCSLRLLK